MSTTIVTLLSFAELQQEIEPLPVFDKPGTYARLDNDEGLLKELLVLFRQDAQQHIQELRSALQGGDAQATTKTAHSIKGALGNIGASRAHRVALELERTGRADKVNAELLGQLENEIQVFLNHFGQS